MGFKKDLGNDNYTRPSKKKKKEKTLLIDLCYHL